ncbi:MAG: glycosyltransferase [Candidatus Electrothrix sp. GM3_4]|nr:glycosyltransferase [Candidatus Electrothrix sp. GM3_4]
MQITHDLAIGGLQQVVVNLCRTIDRNKFHTTVLCLRALGPLVEEIERLGIKVMLLPQKKSGTDYFSFLKVAKILRKERIQVIHTHNTQPLLDGTIGAILSGGRQRIIHTDHARQFPDKKRYMFAEWCMSHFVYKVVGVSEQTTDNLWSYEKIPRRKLMTIENGIDGSLFQISIDKQAKRKELGIPAVGPVIGAISRIEKVKGIKYLLQAMPKIINKFPDITLLIVGDGSEKSSLKAEARQLDVEKNVKFTGARDDIPEILQVLDIYLLPSLSEGLPMGLLEAMAAGCPVIASDVGGIKSVVTNKETVIIVEPGNVQDLLFAVICSLRKTYLEQSVACEVCSALPEKYCAEAMMQKYCDLYSSI